MLNGASIVLATLCTFATVFLVIATKAFCTPYGIPHFGMPGSVMVIVAYIAFDNVPGLHRVPINALTCPEDHLRKAKMKKLAGNSIQITTLASNGI